MRILVHRREVDLCAVNSDYKKTFRSSKTAVKILCTKCIEVFKVFRFFLRSLHQSICLIGCSNSDYFPKTALTTWNFKGRGSVLNCQIGTESWNKFQTTLILPHINSYPTALPYGNGMVLHFYQQQESSTTKTVHKVINKGLKTYV